MTAATTIKPKKDEFLPYYGKYIDLVESGDVLSTLSRQMAETQALLRSLPASVSTYRYAPGKWSVNEVIGHLIDSERIFAARALRFARNDATPLPGFEQDDYVRQLKLRQLSRSASSRRSWARVRESTIFSVQAS